MGLFDDLLTLDRPTVGQIVPADEQVHQPVPIDLAEATPDDIGNSDRFVAAHRDRLRYCPDTERWMGWAGQQWVPGADNGEALYLARRIADQLPGDTADEQRHRARSRSRNGVENMVALARTHPAIRVRLDRFDANPYELNTPTGIVCLHTGTVRAHDPAALHTKITGAGVDFKAPAPAWQQFLHRTFGGDAELIAYMQRLAGLAAIGNVTHHVLPFLFGGGSNGKSVLMDVFTEVLGDYAITAPPNFLLAGRDKHETEIARLHGARLVVCSEVNKDSQFDEAKVKALTGGDKLSGRFMRGNFFDFIPSHTLFLMGNHQPQVSAGGTSFWRRLRLIPFLHTVPPEQRNPRLTAELVADEGAAILAWIVDGARKVIADGLDDPPAVLAATEEYSEATRSGVARFLDEVCTVGGADEQLAAAVHRCYVAWARSAGEPELSLQRFGLDMRAAGIISRKTRDGRYYAITVHTDKLPQQT